MCHFPTLFLFSYIYLYISLLPSFLFSSTSSPSSINTLLPPHSSPSSTPSPHFVATHSTDTPSDINTPFPHIPYPYNDTPTHTSTMKFATAVVFLVALVASASAHMAILYPPPRGGLGTPQYNGRIHVSISSSTHDQPISSGTTNNKLLGTRQTTSKIHEPGYNPGIYIHFRQSNSLSFPNPGRREATSSATQNMHEQRQYADTHINTPTTTTNQQCQTKQKHNNRRMLQFRPAAPTFLYSS